MPLLSLSSFLKIPSFFLSIPSYKWSKLLMMALFLIPNIVHPLKTTTNTATSTYTCDFDFFNTDFVHVLRLSKSISTSIHYTGTTCNFSEEWKAQVIYGYLEVLGIQENKYSYHSSHFANNSYASLIMYIIKYSNWCYIANNFIQ